jgi:hypothetical protein
VQVTGATVCKWRQRFVLRRLDELLDEPVRARPAAWATPPWNACWRAFSRQPHRCQAFKLSRNPLSIDKVRDIVDLYLNPPDRALVLPMRPGQIESRTQRRGSVQG